MENKRIRKAYKPQDFEFGTIATHNEFAVSTGSKRGKYNKQPNSGHGSNYSNLVNAIKPPNTFW